MSEDFRKDLEATLADFLNNVEAFDCTKTEYRLFVDKLCQLMLKHYEPNIVEFPSTMKDFESLTQSIVRERKHYVGSFDKNMEDLALTWTEILRAHYDESLPLLPGHVVAMMMVVMKASRCVRKNSRYDDWTDIHNYMQQSLKSKLEHVQSTKQIQEELTSKTN